LLTLGEAIYREMYQQDYEQNQPGKFVAINIRTKTATLGSTASEALSSHNPTAGALRRTNSAARSTHH
jgi:hypothetical protein